MRFWVLFLLSVSMVSALNGFSISKDYTKNGFGVPGFVTVIIPDVQDVIPAVSGPTLVTATNSRGVRGVQTFIESTPVTSSVPLVMRSPVPFREGSNAPVRPIPVENRDLDCGMYIGEYGLSKQYVKSWDPGRLGR